MKIFFLLAALSACLVSTQVMANGVFGDKVIDRIAKNLKRYSKVKVNVALSHGINMDKGWILVESNVTSCLVVKPNKLKIEDVVPPQKMVHKDPNRGSTFFTIYPNVRFDGKYCLEFTAPGRDRFIRLPITKVEDVQRDDMFAERFGTARRCGVDALFGSDPLIGFTFKKKSINSETGAPTYILERTVQFVAGGQRARTEIEFDAKTLLPVALDEWLEFSLDEFFHNLHAVYSDWDFNPKFTDSDFDTTPPEGGKEDMNGKYRAFMDDLLLKPATTKKKK
ncbi:MAG: hypothetical protein ABJA67_10065 [Chthonomonadales bacterium]